jgi:hypothetical protein
MMTDFVGIAGGRFGLMDLDVGNGCFEIEIATERAFFRTTDPTKLRAGSAEAEPGTFSVCLEFKARVFEVG